MNEMIEETVKNRIQPGERDETDYIGEDGLLYCGKCHEPKEVYFDSGKDTNGNRRSVSGNVSAMKPL